MEIKLTGKRAMVGASTSGLGRAIAWQLAECGATISLVSRNEGKLKALVAALPNAHGQQHNYLVADFNDSDAYVSLIETWFKDYPVDILVNNTQGPAPGGVLDKTGGDYQIAFNLLFQNVCAASLAALPNMKRKGWGRIINVSSLTVSEPSPSLVLSNTMRTALLSWAKSLSQELAQDNITVNSILTGFFDTERMNNLIEEQALASGRTVKTLKDERSQLVPMKRFGRPEEYAYLTAFLASDLAAYITGTSIPIDGGLLKSL